MPMKFYPNNIEIDLTTLLKKSLSNSEELHQWLSKDIFTNASASTIEKSFKQFLIKNLPSLDKDKLLWADYVWKLLVKIINPDFIQEFYAIDYLLKYEDSHNPHYLQYGADIAFLRGSIFHGKQKMISPKNYLQISKNLYYNRWNQTENPLGEILYYNLDFFSNQVQQFLKLL